MDKNFIGVYTIKYKYREGKGRVFNSYRYFRNKEDIKEFTKVDHNIVNKSLYYGVSFENNDIIDLHSFTLDNLENIIENHQKELFKQFLGSRYILEYEEYYTFLDCGGKIKSKWFDRECFIFSLYDIIEACEIIEKCEKTRNIKLKFLNRCNYKTIAQDFHFSFYSLKDIIEKHQKEFEDQEEAKKATKKRVARKKMKKAKKEEEEAFLRFKEEEEADKYVVCAKCGKKIAYEEAQFDFIDNKYYCEECFDTCYNENNSKQLDNILLDLLY